MRPLFLFAFALPFVVACGKGASDSLPNDAGTSPTDAAACSGDPNLHCTQACSDEPVPATCVDGQWTCSVVTIDCIDAGPVSCPPTKLECPLPCGGGSVPPTCTEGGWVCPVFNGGLCPVEDAGGCGEPPPGPCGAGDPCATWSLECTPSGTWECVQTSPGCADASIDASPPDDGGEPPFACGNSACDPGTTFCAIVVGGPVNEDGGASSSEYCLPLPSTCASGSASCACVAAGEQSPGACGCIQSGDHVIVTCDLN